MKRFTLVRIQLEITPEDIEEMYTRYDSGMSDPTTTNAVCLALRRRLRPECQPRIVHSATRVQTCTLQLGSAQFSMPEELYWWLEHVNNGHLAEPASFSIEVPEEFALKEVETNHSVRDYVAA